MADDEDVVAEEAPVALLDEPEEITPEKHVEQPLAPPKYEVRPGLGEKFQAANVKYIILTSMQEQLMGRQYRSDQVSRWAKTIANGVRQRVQDLNMKRYKIVVQSTIVEMKGAGIKCGLRLMWDPETDDYVDDLFRNDTMFCYTAVYAMYMY